MTKSRGRFKTILANRGFQALLWTQFLGTFNRNLYKIIVVMWTAFLAADAQAAARYLLLAGAIFVIPFLLFSGYSGYLADRFSKRLLLIAGTVSQIGVITMGFAVLFSTRIEWMLVVLFLMALESTIFRPAKYGVVPEIIPEKDLTRANGLIGLTGAIAIVLGVSISSFLFAASSNAPRSLGLVMIGVAFGQFLVSRRITRVGPCRETAPFRWNPFAEVITGTRHLLRDRPLLLAAIGISYFWFLGLLFQMNLLFFGREVLRASDTRIGLMFIALALGAGAGSMFAGRLSGNKVEIGLIPFGSILMLSGCVALYAAKSSYCWSMAALALLGISSGLYIVPLNAFLQQRSEKTEVGRILATNSFYNAIAMLLALAAFAILHVSADKMLLLLGGVTLAAAIYVVRLVPEYLVRFVLWIAFHALYKIRIVGSENVPLRGAALLVANHTTHLDGFFIGACIQRFVRYMVWKPYYEMKGLNTLLRFAKAIPVGTNGPRDMVASLRAARRELEKGHFVCIFAEGSITRTGNLLPFKRGLERIAEGLDVPVIPVHLDRLWGSVFSFEGGHFFRKWPKRVPYPITVSFGKPMPAASNAHQVRRAIVELASAAVEYRKTSGDVLSLRFVRAARKHFSSFAMADSAGRELTYGRALAESILISRWVRKNRASDSMVGLMLPPSVAGALANVGVMMSGKTPVNLNFSAGVEAMRSAMRKCQIQTIVTSRPFQEEAGVPQLEEMVFIEDIFASMSPIARFCALVAARCAPAYMLVRRTTSDSLATVMFSSAPAGVCEGAMLSHYNIISNIEALAQAFPLDSTDRIVGVFPLFHSCGFTATIWLPLISGCGVVYHSASADAKTIGALVDKHAGTILLSTPASYDEYVRKCSRQQFSSLRYALVMTGTLHESVAKGFEKTFGLELLAGYGRTEMSGIVAVNVPNVEFGRETQVGRKPGTVGHPLPGVAIKVVDPATNETLDPQTEGLLLVRGSNRMIGYLGNPDLTARRIDDGWFRTGDLAMIDEEGFLRITKPGWETAPGSISGEKVLRHGG